MIGRMATGRFFSGLDVGGVRELTALAVLERTTLPDPHQTRHQVCQYAVRHLERFPLGTPYPEVCSRVRQLFAKPPLQGSCLTVDLTGVGRPVFQLLRQAHVGAQLSRVLLTAGHQATLDLGDWLVPKVELISTLQVLLQSRRLRVAPEMPHAQTLVEELANFTMKVKLADQEDERLWRERSHDDLVFAAALAAWQGQRCHGVTP